MQKTLIFIGFFLITLNLSSQKLSSPDNFSQIESDQQFQKKKSFMLTHSISQIIDPATSVSCNSNGEHYENSYYRVFDLQNEFDLNGDWVLQTVEFGIGLAISGNSDKQPLELRFYVMSQYDNEIILDSLTAKGDTLYLDIYNSDSGSLRSFDVIPNVTVTLGQVLVVEVFMPNGQTDDHILFMGSNDLGETDSTYIKASDCGIDNPVPMSDILFPDMHLVFNIYGEYENPNPQINSFYIAGQLNSEILNEPEWRINVIMPVDSELDALAPIITVPAGFQVIPGSGETVDFSQGPVTYEVNNELSKVSQMWDVYVENAGPDILQVQVPSQNGETLIDNENHTVFVPVPFGTDLTSVSPDITIYDDQGFTIDPESGTVQDFSLGPVTYHVSHETLPLSQDWQISVVEAQGTDISIVEHKIISVFPNPACDFIYINGNGIFKIEIFSLNGKIVCSESSAGFADIRSIPSGIYILKIQTKQKIFIEKLIISR